MDFSRTSGVVAKGGNLAVPGPAIGEIDTGIINVVPSLDAVDRGEVAGYRASVKGNVRMLIPRISRVDYEKLQLSRLPEVDGYMERLAGRFVALSSTARAELVKRKAAVRQTLGDGTERVVLIDRMPSGGLDETEMMERELPFPDERERLTEEELKGRRKSKKHALSQVLNDGCLQEKYMLGERQLGTAKRIAISNPAAAAKFLQDSMNLVQEDVNVVVKAGEYIRDKSQARNTLGTMCYEYKPRSASVQAEVIGEALFMYGPNGEDDWHVSGPIKYAKEVTYLYWMIYVEGGTDPCVLLGLEMDTLGLNYYDGATSVAPVLQYHAGYDGAPIPPVGIAEATAGMLSAAQRTALEAMADRLLPVMGSDGIQLATAVRVTGLHVLVNSHVLDADPMCTVGGAAVEANTQLSRDLWSVRHKGDAEAWSMREPVVGELVAVCYIAGGKVSSSPPLRVMSVEESCVVTSLSDEVVARMSGGALVALSDMSLLGVHSASTWTSLLSYRFGTAQFSALLESVSESCFSRQDDLDSFANRISEHFKKRGLGSVFKSALQALEPVYIGPDHAGMAVRSGEYLYTACDAYYPLRFGSGRAAYVMETIGDSKLYRTRAAGSGTSPVYRRNPVNFEKVFVVGYDTDAYMSSETAVLHVGPNSRSFIIGSIPGVDKPVLGGLVMGFDGAVLGVCGSISATTAAGLGYVCWPLPEAEVRATLDVRGSLTVRFPFLNMAAWTDSLLEEVFTHSSAGKYRDGRPFNAGNKPLANVGDNAAKAELYDGLRLAAVPHSQWSGAMQGLQSNQAFARAAWKFGFAECLVFGLGAVFSRESKVYADLTEALLGAAYLVERREVFKQLCSAMGILHTASAGFGGEGDYFSMSGSGVLRGVGEAPLTSPEFGEDAQSRGTSRLSMASPVSKTNPSGLERVSGLPGGETGST